MSYYSLQRPGSSQNQHQPVYRTPAQTQGAKKKKTSPPPRRKAPPNPNFANAINNGGLFGSSTPPKMNTPHDSKTSSSTDFRLLSQWNDDFLGERMLSSMQHTRAELMALPRSLPYNILGVNPNNIPGAKSKKQAIATSPRPPSAGTAKKVNNPFQGTDDKEKLPPRRKRKQPRNPIPREQRVFLRCPRCNHRVHVRNVCCPSCGLSKADVRKRQVYAAKPT